MATNVFFSQAVKTEQNLIEDLVVESLRMYGHNCYYLPRKIVNEDTILGDAADSKFEDAYEVEMYLEGVEGFEGEGDLYSKFGVEVRDTATFILSRRSWERFVSLDANLATGLRPNEGDLIYFPLSKSVFEIKFVEHENPFYQLGKLYVFKLTCDLFEYSGEDFDTNIEALDVDLELAQGTAIELTLADTPTLRDFVIGESVSQQISNTVVVSGTVSAWDEASNKLTISRISSTDTTDTFQTFQLTDTTVGNITAEDSLDNDKIILSGTGQEGYYIDFESNTATITLPSFITDGTTGTDNLTLETHTQGSGILLESGTSIDSTEFDHIVLEDSLASRRTINTVGSDQQLSTDAGAFNLDIETDADGIIDFSEGNPFGDAT
tara:strand:+ start:859 stop:1998 length:1140 start_codon:yes stop_codon:yes gene_type:complete